MPSAAEFQAKVEKSTTNMDRLDGIVNGGPTAVINTDNGPVPSLAKVIAETGYTGDGAERAEAAAAAASESAAIAEEAAAQIDILEGLNDLLADTSILRASPFMQNSGDPKIAFRTPSNRLIPLVDANGYPVIHTDDGPVPVPDAGMPGLSPGVVDGEALKTWWRDPVSGYVMGGIGAQGGQFWLVNGILKRLTGAASASAPATPTYAGQTWVDASQQELLARPMDTSKTAYIFVGAGQSNYDGENQNASDPMISAAAVYPNYALMLQNGPRMVTAANATTLVPLVENVTNQGGGIDRQRETPTSGWVNHFIRDYYAAWSQYPTVVGLSIAIGGHPYIGVKKGTRAFRDLAQGIAATSTALRARGITDIRTVIGWVWGETDTAPMTRMNVDRAKKQAHQFRRDAGDIIRRITGEVADPLVVMIQNSNVVNGQPWYQPVRQAMVELDGEPGFLLAGPGFQFPMTGSAVPADNNIHRNNLGKYSTGQMLARATMAEMLGATWRGVKPLLARWGNAAGTQLVIECDSMGANLVKDSSAISTTGLANDGFLFEDGSGSPPAISSVSVSGQTITVMLAAKPTGPDCRIGYALARNSGAGDADGPVLGARGTIRDDQAHIRISDGAAQYNWLSSFVMRLPTP